MQQFKVGDHVIVDEGDAGHFLDVGLDGLVVAVGYTVLVEGYSTHHGRVSWQYVKSAALIKVDDLVTFPALKPGDRAIVTGNTGYADGGCKHVLDVGTDVEIVDGLRMVNGRLLYDVIGMGRRGTRYTQYVAPCDLEAEPTYRPRGPVLSFYTKAPNYSGDLAADFERAYSRAKRSIEFTLTPHAIDVLAGGTITSSTADNDARAAALSKAIEVLGADRDIDELTAVADWLLGDAA